MDDTHPHQQHQHQQPPLLESNIDDIWSPSLLTGNNNYDQDDDIALFDWLAGDEDDMKDLRLSHSIEKDSFFDDEEDLNRCSELCISPTECTSDTTAATTVGEPYLNWRDNASSVCDSEDLDDTSSHHSDNLASTVTRVPQFKERKVTFKSDDALVTEMILNATSGSDEEALHDKMARLRVYNRSSNNANFGGSTCNLVYSSHLGTINEEDDGCESTSHYYEEDDLALNFPPPPPLLSTEEGLMSSPDWSQGRKQHHQLQQQLDNHRGAESYAPLHIISSAYDLPMESAQGSEPALSEISMSERGDSEYGDNSEWGETASSIDESDWCEPPLPLSPMKSMSTPSHKIQSPVTLQQAQAQVHANIPTSMSLPTLTLPMTSSTPKLVGSSSSICSNSSHRSACSASSNRSSNTGSVHSSSSSYIVDHTYHDYSLCPPPPFPSSSSTNNTSSNHAQLSSYHDIPHTYVGHRVIFTKKTPSSPSSCEVVNQSVCKKFANKKRHCDVSRNTFPKQLHQLLSNNSMHGHGPPHNVQHIVSWQPHGRAFLVRNSKKMESEVLLRYFKQTKIKSFLRQLNKWGFKRITKGIDEGCYYHELFLRGKPWLINNMRYIKVKGDSKQMTTNPVQEPDFYALALIRPLLEINGTGNDHSLRSCSGDNSHTSSSSRVTSHSTPSSAATTIAVHSPSQHYAPPPTGFPVTPTPPYPYHPYHHHHHHHHHMMYYFPPPPAIHPYAYPPSPLPYTQPQQVHHNGKKKKNVKST
mmetsp:Transcript_20005/g.25923  ORF Transcript_20005/g.25923 Transcript_20005/m.25923 type:complete len:756 (-) Transcript_20005:63-2330(-)